MTKYTVEQDIITTNHRKIKEWIEDNGGRPAIICRADIPSINEDEVGLRISFGGKDDKKLLGAAKISKNISWKNFFKLFERKGLAFIYQLTPKGPDISWTYRFIRRENVDKEE
jgi:hypothetical protein